MSKKYLRTITLSLSVLILLVSGFYIFQLDLYIFGKETTGTITEVTKSRGKHWLNYEYKILYNDKRIYDQPINYFAGRDESITHEQIPGKEITEVTNTKVDILYIASNPERINVKFPNQPKYTYLVQNVETWNLFMFIIILIALGFINILVSNPSFALSLLKRKN